MTECLVAKAGGSSGCCTNRIDQWHIVRTRFDFVESQFRWTPNLGRARSASLDVIGKLECNVRPLPSTNRTAAPPRSRRRESLSAAGPLLPLSGGRPLTAETRHATTRTAIAGPRQIGLQRLDGALHARGEQSWRRLALALAGQLQQRRHPPDRKHTGLNQGGLKQRRRATLPKHEPIVLIRPGSATTSSLTPTFRTPRGYFRTSAPCSSRPPEQYFQRSTSTDQAWQARHRTTAWHEAGADFPL